MVFQCAKSRRFLNRLLPPTSIPCFDGMVFDIGVSSGQVRKFTIFKRYHQARYSIFDQSFIQNTRLD